MKENLRVEITTAENDSEKLAGEGQLVRVSWQELRRDIVPEVKKERFMLDKGRWVIAAEECAGGEDSQ